MREYNFTWTYEPISNTFLFTNCNFRRGHPEQVCNLHTRRGLGSVKEENIKRSFNGDEDKVPVPTKHRCVEEEMRKETLKCHTPKLREIDQWPKELQNQSGFQAQKQSELQASMIVAEDQGLQCHTSKQQEIYQQRKESQNQSQVQNCTIVREHLVRNKPMQPKPTRSFETIDLATVYSMTRIQDSSPPQSGPPPQSVAPAYRYQHPACNPNNQAIPQQHVSNINPYTMYQPRATGHNPLLPMKLMPWGRVLRHKTYMPQVAIPSTVQRNVTQKILAVEQGIQDPIKAPANKEYLDQKQWDTGLLELNDVGIPMMEYKHFKSDYLPSGLDISDTKSDEAISPMKSPDKFLTSSQESNCDKNDPLLSSALLTPKRDILEFSSPRMSTPRNKHEFLGLPQPEMSPITSPWMTPSGGDSKLHHSINTLNRSEGLVFDSFNLPSPVLVYSQEHNESSEQGLDSSDGFLSQAPSQINVVPSDGTQKQNNQIINNNNNFVFRPHQEFPCHGQVLICMEMSDDDSTDSCEEAIEYITDSEYSQQNTQLSYSGNSSSGESGFE